MRNKTALFFFCIYFYAENSAQGFVTHSEIVSQTAEDNGYKNGYRESEDVYIDRQHEEKAYIHRMDDNIHNQADYGEAVAEAEYEKDYAEHGKKYGWDIRKHN